MATYQRRRLSDMTDIGDPGPLPDAFYGIRDDGVLQNLPAHFDTDALAQLGFAGMGLFRVDPDSFPVGRWIHKAVLLQRMSAEKRIGIREAAKTDPIIEDFLDLLYQTDEVDLDNTNLVAGLGYLVLQSLLTADDVTAIRA
jgi:hypothetical protein